jgi:transcriptional regulator with XRE-family HTH domain
MSCEICGTKIVERIATPDSPYQYTLSGLKDIFLVGIKIRRCIQCGTDSPVIPRIVELNKLIAEGIAEKPEPLSGEALRYLRTFAGFSGKSFAALLEVNPSHLSRFEHGNYTSLGKPADKLARALAMSAVDEECVRKILLQVADDRIDADKEQRRKKKTASPTFKLIRNRWTRAA